MADPLRARLFGYGVPYRARLTGEGALLPLETSPEREAADLAGELAALTGQSTAPVQGETGVWATCVPFGRCGVEDLPLEHLKVYNLEDGWLEVLGEDGAHELPLREGKLVRISPRSVVRLRARPRPGRRVLVAFQTQDRTPLLGNAAPFTLDGQAPDEYAARLTKAQEAFVYAQGLAGKDQAAYRQVLEAFFSRMAAKVEADPQVGLTQAQAREEGAYATEGEEELFARQQALLSPEVIARIGRQDPELFRFPGMFGGITTLFKIYNT
ncbi:MAG: hypothetical protein IT369_16805 [Candidatus Latescibacteria bacterium]|nr:hypothetical protein [Candidatus Latescibacterota bacterium]